MRVPLDLLPEHWRDYQIVTLTGWSPDVIAAAPAVLIDHLLAIDGVVKEMTGGAGG